MISINGLTTKPSIYIPLVIKDFFHKKPKKGKKPQILNFFTFKAFASPKIGVIHHSETYYVIIGGFSQDLTP